jgi:hypothetical protein
VRKVALLVALDDNYKDEPVDERLRKGSWQ